MFQESDAPSLRPVFFLCSIVVMYCVPRPMRHLCLYNTQCSAKYAFLLVVDMYRIDHCVVRCMTCYLPQEKLSPVEAKEVQRAKPKVLPRLPRERVFPKVDNGSYTPLRSGLSILYYA